MRLARGASGCQCRGQAFAVATRSHPERTNPLADMTLPPIFDGHNDVLLKLDRAGGVAAAETFLTGRDGHIDRARALAGGFGGGFFAIYVPSPIDLDTKIAEMTKPAYSLPLPDMIPVSEALPVVLKQAAILVRLEQLGALKICTSVADIRESLASGIMAAIMHIEGAEAIDPDFHTLDVLYHAGLRSIGPVWSRADDLRPRRAVPLSQQPRYRPRPDRSRAAAGETLQRRWAS